LQKREVNAALRATLALPPQAVESLVDSSWLQWTSGDDVMDFTSLQRMAAALASRLDVGVAIDLVPPPPDLVGAVQDASSTERILARKSSHVGASKLDHRHSVSGNVCKCGKVHIRRGDRVRRGAAPWSGEHGEETIAAGQLGTIVRVGKDQQSVLIKWDRSPTDMVHTYTWPDPGAEVVLPASFEEVLEDALEVSRTTGLSSVAAENALRIVNFGLKDCVETYARCPEDEFRTTPKLYQRVRILPDHILVQQWFDGIPPPRCACTNCSGGVKWTSRADAHLGMEGYVLQIDEDDGTILVETCGPCKCTIWYPRMAAEPVYDPDIFDMPTFEQEQPVECRMENGWKRGVVRQVLWNGPDRTGPYPYTVTLDDSSSIVVPTLDLIRAATSS